MAKIIMDSGKEYEVDEECLENLVYENASGIGYSPMKIRTGLIRIPGKNIVINPNHISSIESLGH